MDFFDTDNLEKIHNRNFDLSTFVVDPEHLLITGEFKERNLITVYRKAGERSEPRMYHHMQVQLLVNITELKIVDIKAKMPTVPNSDICREMENSLDKLKGLVIAPGFTQKVKKLAGGIRGCTHLTTLLISMAPVVLQGYWIVKGRNKERKELTRVNINDYLIDTCWAWRKDGPLARTYIQEG